MEPIDPRIPGDYNTCAKRHGRVYWQSGPCPVCDALDEVRAVEKAAADEIREAERNRGRDW